MVEIVDRLNLSHLFAAYSGKGSKAYSPAMIVALLFYAYATGVFSSRKLEKATYDSVAFRYICGNTNPDHDTIANFRKRFLKELEGLFVEILLVAEAMGLLKLGTVSLDGTKIKANASKHQALSWEHANLLEEQLKGEVEELLRLAEEADHSSLPEDMDIPDELAHREKRLIGPKRKSKRAPGSVSNANRWNMKRRWPAAKPMKKPPDARRGGRSPSHRHLGPGGKDQVNLTDEESRIMPVSGGGFEQAFNVQGGVDVETHLIVEQHVTQNPNDKQEIEPALEKIATLPGALGEVETILADTGYFSETNVEQCQEAGIEPLIPEKRQPHNLPLKERFKKDPEPEPDATPLQTMRHRMNTKEGKTLYAKRKSTVETVFGIIKQVQGFRQFMLRGLDSVQSEWALVCIGWNLKRLHTLKG